MKKELLCIVCPNGCRLTAELAGEELTVTGQGCKRGIDFARAELTHPMRSLTTTVKTVFDGVPVLPVRTAGEIPKERVFDAMAAIGAVVLERRVGCGEVVLPDLLGTGVDLIATSDILTRG